MSLVVVGPERTVDDVKALHARLVALGFHARSESVVDIVAGPKAGAHSCYMTDPDGYAVELFEKPADR